MARISVYIATTLDGFIARANGGIDWLEHPAGGEDYGYRTFFNSVDRLVMGRNSFEKVLTFGDWPYGGTPVTVMSSGLTQDDVPAALRDEVEVSSQTPAQIVAQAGDDHLYIDGGKVVQSFLRDGLVGDLILSRLPVLIGEGIPLFGTLPADVRFEHLSTQSFPSGLVQSRYRALRSGEQA